MIFRSRKNRDSATPVIERNPESIAASERAEELREAGDWFAAIDVLTEANRNERDPELERQIRTTRHLAGIELIKNAPADPQYAEPAATPIALNPETKIPEATPDEVTPELLRSAILNSGCLLIRDVMDDDLALEFAADIEAGIQRRKEIVDGASFEDGLYEEMEPEDPFKIAERAWVEEGGGFLAADSPKLLFDMLEGFEKANLRSLIEGYLGEKPAISAQKCTLRRVTPDIPGAWHQDGKFLGDVRSLNVWLALSRCGDVAPGMDVLPRRLEEFVATGGEGTYLDIQISEKTVSDAAGDIPVVRPVFNPGDALLFDHFFLHQTGSDPAMPNTRYAIESWFFGPSAYPENYVPIAF
jgi:hypothetical protein